MKLATDIRYVGRYYYKGFQGQRSDVRVMTTPINLAMGHGRSQDFLQGGGANSWA